MSTCRRTTRRRMDCYCQLLVDTGMKHTPGKTIYHIVPPARLILSALIQFSCVSFHHLLVKLTSFGGLSVDGPAAEINRRAAKAEVLNLSLDVLQARNGLLGKNTPTTNSSHDYDEALGFSSKSDRM